ncbi:MAG: hypothetical protein ACI9TH_002148 [Kiritimatiellia bacterium]|jgi:hypothetical protein
MRLNTPLKGIALVALPLTGMLHALRAESIDFNRDIRPILQANCFVCHGPDEEARKGKLRIDTEAGARADLGEGHAALIPGKPDESEIVYRVETEDPDDIMPPLKSEHRLTDDEKARLRAWIKSGGAYAEHWSFVSPTKASPPKVQETDWPSHPLDHFVLARLEDAKVPHAARADRYTLIRRVSLDLTGLPPTPEEADAYVQDASPDAWAKVVERLLASPHFGERWARMWLDLARYADTRGYEKDKHRDMWRYREWVIDAFNQDLSLDAFTRDQLAGDLIPDSTPEQLVATAFHRNTMTNEEGGTDNEEYRVAAVKDRVDTTMQVWMGITMGCAKCHTHKYDPVTISDYYAFYAFFNQTEDNDNEAPSAPTPSPDQVAELARLDNEIARLDKSLSPTSPAFAAWKKSQQTAPNPWTDVRLEAFTSRHAGAGLEQDPDGLLRATGTRPDKDTWTVTVIPPAGKLTALRLETLPKKAINGRPKDLNVAIREITVELAGPEATPRKLTLKNPRADFSQKGWEVAKAIDGDVSAGWAFSPQKDVPHAAVFDLETPIEASPDTRLRLTLEQQYGQQLILGEFRLRVSGEDPSLLTAAVDGDAGLFQAFLQASPDLKSLDQQRTKARAAHKQINDQIPKTLVMRELPANRQRTTRIQQRGNFLDPGDVVTPQVPTIFASWPVDAPTNRLGVAEWLIRADNPLTDRVFVNRIWARLFGIGIVETEEDFGLQGLPPDNPALLDWLAVDFRDNGRSLKQLLRTLVHSSTYQQAAEMKSAHASTDPNNRMLSRASRFRLPAETIRDQALVASGLLTRSLGGPSVMPPQPDGVWKTTYNVNKWVNATDGNRYRRGLYTYLKRTSPYPSLTTFDAGSGEVCQIRRVRTNTPLQALITLNDPAFLEMAGALATRMQEAGSDPTTRISRGFRLALIRPPTERELQGLMQLYDRLNASYAAQPEAGTELARSAGLNDSHKTEPALIGIANALLNLDELLMKP